MCNVLRVRWTIFPKIAPQPWIACSGCRSHRPFRSSGKIRLNANGKKLDAWLIYKCCDCDRTWNRPLLERQAVRDISAADLEALQSNDPEWIRAYEFDIAGLSCKARRIDECAEVDVHKEVLNGASEDVDILEVALVVPLPVGVRLDRLLATELGLSRSALHALHEQGHLRTDPDHKGILRRRASHCTRVTLKQVKKARR